MKQFQGTESVRAKYRRRQKAAKTAYKSNLQKRLAFIFILVAAALLVLSGVLIHIVRTQGDDYSKVVLTQQNYSSSTISFRRGDITDRNGSLLATSERVYILILDPTVILFNDGVNEAATLEALQKVYNYDQDVEGTTDLTGIDAAASIKNGAKIVYLDTNNSSVDFHLRKEWSLK